MTISVLSPPIGDLALIPVWPNAGVPSNGTTGTRAGFAQRGDLLADTVNGTLYQNTGTQASPTWTEFSAGGGGITQLTGAVTAGPGSGSQVTTIPAASITYAEIQNVAAHSLVGNPTGSAAVAEGVTLGANLTFNGTAIDAGDAPLVLTGQTVVTPGSAVGTLTNLPVAGNPTIIVSFNVNGTPYGFLGWPLS